MSCSFLKGAIDTDFLYVISNPYFVHFVIPSILTSSHNHLLVTEYQSSFSLEVNSGNVLLDITKV